MSSVAVRACEWLDQHPCRSLALAVALAVGLRVPFLARAVSPDEGGFLMVASQWHLGRGTSLYGDQWVDRPPLLILVFKFAVVLGGSPVVVHLIGTAFAVLLAGAAWWAGHTINGARGAVAASLATAAVAANVNLSGSELTGELIAGTFVMGSCALLLHAAYGAVLPRPALLFAIAAGVTASMAFLVKQNFLDAALFALVLLGLRARQTWPLIAAYVVGLALPLLITVGWAVSADGPGLVKLFHALFAFRQQVLDILEDANSVGPLSRLAGLGEIFVFSGLVLLSWQLFSASVRLSEHRSLRVGLVAMWLYAVISIVVGVSWWHHYLLQLVPVLALGTALATRQRAWPGYTRFAAAVVIVASVVAAASGGWQSWRSHVPSDQEAVGSYLRSASNPDDTLFVAYGSPNILWDSGLRAPYPFSWSLPIRGRDPHLKRLDLVLTGPDAPTWIVEIGDFNMWGLDTSAFQRIRATDYHVVATVCGHDVYLRDTATQTLPAVPACAPA